MDGERIRAIVHEIGERLEGDWLLIGGGLVALWIEPGRTTEDLDIVGMAGCDDPRLALLQLADDLGLPVETLNSAADFFVQRIDGWEREVELLQRGSVGRIFRPSATLFLLLKVGRPAPDPTGRKCTRPSDSTFCSRASQSERSCALSLLSEAARMSYSPDGSRLAVATYLGFVYLLRPESTAPILDLRPDTGWLWAVGWSPDGRHLAAGGGTYEGLESAFWLWSVLGR